MIPLILALLLATSFSMGEDLSAAQEFGEFMKEFSREYATVEETVKRFRIFSENFRHIQEHNAQPHGYTLKANQFSDLTTDELNAIFKGIETEKGFCQNRSLEGSSGLVDWREKGVVTSVKNEECCNANWAFASAGAVESLHAIRHRELKDLSAQELLDCSGEYGNAGCKGGSAESSLEYIADKGVSTEEEYHYVGRKGSCKKMSNGFKISSCIRVPPENTQQLLRALNKNPILIAVKANNRNFLNYNSGILRLSCGGKNDKLDHYVLLVGAGWKNKYPCWIVKNSWGKHWGEGGYAYILREEGQFKNVCGITEYSIYPS